MTAINTNVAAIRASNAATDASKMLGTAMERLSTGKRINSAGDDAAGLAIANSMTSQIRGMSQGVRNANDGISLAQTAEGALQEVSNMFQRMRELKVQYENGTYSTDDQANINSEMDALAAQIGSVLANTEFNGTALFTGASASNITIQAGANASDTVTIAVGGLSTNTAITNVTGTPDSATFAQYDTAIALVSTTRAGLGASQNQLESAVNNLNSNIANLSDARSRIEDADYAAESTALAKSQILSQASTAMLAQANQSQQNVLSLLR